MFEKNINGCAIVTASGQFIAANEEFARLLNYSELELMKMTWQQLTIPDDLDDDQGNVDRILDGKVDGYEMTKHYITKRREIVEAKIRVDGIRDERGKIVCLYSQIVRTPSAVAPGVSSEVVKTLKLMSWLRTNWPVVLWVASGLTALIGYILKERAAK